MSQYTIIATVEAINEDGKDFTNFVYDLFYNALQEKNREYNTKENRLHTLKVTKDESITTNNT